MAFFLSNDVKQMLFMLWGKIYRLTISQLLTDISTHYLPTIAQVFDSFLSDLYIGQVSTLSWPTTYIFWLSTKCWLYTLWIISKMSARYQCSIRLSEVLVNYKAMWADIPVHLDQHISQVSNWPTVNWYNNRLRLRTLHCDVQSWLHSIASCLFSDW